VDHGVAHVFGGGFVAAEAKGYVVGGAVVFDDAGMFDGDVGGALVEVGDGIAAGVHERGDQFIGFDDGAFGVVDETRLDGLPVGEIALAFGGGEVADVKFVYALFAGGEAGFGLGCGAMLEDGAIVFRAEALTKAGGLLAAVADDEGNGDHDDHRYDNQGNDEFRV